jgi:hypothetical protein
MGEADEDTDPEEFGRQARENIVLEEGLKRAPLVTPSEMADFVQEFSEDRVFHQTSEGIKGDLPEENKRRFWSINSKNFVFSRYDELDERRIDNMQLILELSLGTFTVNNDYFLRKKRLLENLTDKNKIEDGINRLNDEYQQSCRKMYDILDILNQDIQTFAKTKRAGDGEPGAERKAIYTTAISSLSERPQAGKSRGLLNSWFGRGK